MVEPHGCAGSRNRLEPARRWSAFAVAAGSVALWLATGAQASHENVRTNFDSFADGTTPVIGAVTFTGTGTIGPPTVFTVPSGETSSPPRALQASQACSFNGCANGAYQLRMTFARGATRVAMNFGTAQGDITEIGIAGRLIGYDASGAQAGASADSGDVFARQKSNGVYPIATPIAISDPTGRIRSAILYVGKGTRGSEGFAGPRRARIDDLVVEFLHGTEPPPPPDPPAPTVSITSPSARQFFARPENVTVSGRVTAPAGVSGFCVGTNRTAPPEPCSAGSAVRSDGTYGPIGVGGLRAGRNTITAWARDNRSRLASATVEIDVSAPSLGVDVRASGLWVLQAVQERALFGTGRAPIPDPEQAIHLQYRGAKLVAGGKTIVRLLAEVRATPGVALRTVPGVPALLFGFRLDGDRRVPLPGSPLSPDNGLGTLRQLPLGLDVEAAMRDPNGAYVFTLPHSWATGRIELRGEVNSGRAVYQTPLIECGPCARNNVVTTTNIEFEHRGPVTISPVAIYWRDSSGTLFRPTMSAWEAFDATRALTPLGEGQFNVRPMRAAVDVSEVYNRTYDPDEWKNWDKRRIAIFDFVGDHAAFSLTGEEVGEGVVFGLHNGGPGGSASPGGFATPYFWNLGLRGYGIAGHDRPLLEVAHEFLHTQRFRHIGNECGGGGVSWDAPRGRFFDMAIDRRPGSGPSVGTYRILLSPVPGGTNNDTEIVDLMSYCANEMRTWTSLLTWNSFGHTLPYGIRSTSGTHVLPPGARLSARDLVLAAAPKLRVFATIDVASGETTVVSVKGGTLAAPTPSELGAQYRIVVRDDHGGIVSSTGVTPFRGEQLTIFAEVPAPNAARVEITRDNVVVASRSASAHRPTVKLVAPRSGRLPRTGTVKVRWRSSDADGRTQLRTRVEYSVDGGKTYRVLTTTLGATSAVLPVSYLGGTTNGRIRLVANDGFRDAVTTSGRLIAAGTPPVVTIHASARPLRVRNDAILTLGGEGYDDRLQAIAPARLTWFSGRRKLGSGETVAIRGLAPGRHDVRLVAQDRRGRRGSARVRVVVRSSPPVFVGLVVPERIAPRARFLTFRTGSTVAGRLSVAGRRYTVGRTPRGYRLSIRRGRQPLRLVMTLAAGGRRTTITRYVDR